MVVHLQKVTKVDKAAQVIRERWRTKADRCLSSAVFPKVDLTTFNRIEYKVFNLGQLEST